MGFLYILCEALILISSKIWEEWIFRVNHKFMYFPKHGKSEFSCYRKSMRKHKYFKVMDFLHINPSRNPHNFQTVRWVNSHLTKQVWEATDNPQVLLYLTDLGLIETHAIPTVWGCTNSHGMEIFFGKPYHSKAVGFRGN